MDGRAPPPVQFEISEITSEIVCGSRQISIAALETSSPTRNGYQFCKKLIVELRGGLVAAPITDIDRHEDVRNVRNRDVRNVLDGRGAERRAWILEQLAAGQHLRARKIMKQFDCSLKTAERDLQGLKEAGQIEFIGVTRAGYYRLVDGTEATATSGG